MKFVDHILIDFFVFRFVIPNMYKKMLYYLWTPKQRTVNLIRLYKNNWQIAQLTSIFLTMFDCQKQLTSKTYQLKIMILLSQRKMLTNNLNKFLFFWFFYNIVEYKSFVFMFLAFLAFSQCTLSEVTLSRYTNQILGRRLKLSMKYQALRNVFLFAKAALDSPSWIR